MKTIFTFFSLRPIILVIAILSLSVNNSYAACTIGNVVATAGSNITCPSFRANWNAPTGIPANYYIDVSTSPTFATSLATYPKYTGSTSLNYTVAINGNGTYYYRVKAYCSTSGGGLSPSWSNTITVVVNVAGCYCTPTGANLYGYISNVNVNSGVINRTSVYDGYINTGLSATVLQGVTYPLSISMNNTSTTGRWTAVWIDWNQNNILDDVGENVMPTAISTVSGADSRTLNITVPSGASLGNTKMRVVHTYQGGSYAAPTPCAAAYASSSDWEDYTINVVAPVNCSGTPTAGTISPATSTITTAQSVNLTWSETHQLGFTYQWQSGPSATGPWTDISGATTNPYNVSGLSAGTTYFHLVVTCTNSGLSNTSASAQVTVTLVYCAPGALACVTGGPTNYHTISRVQFGTLDNSSATTSCGASGYTDYTGSVAAPTFIIGSSNNLTITNAGTLSPYSAGVWIDYNQNGSFLDPGEYTSIGQGTITAGSSTTVPVLIPTTANTGNMRMRIQFAYGSAVLSSWTCFTNAVAGETEDYLVNLACGATPLGVTGRFPADGLPLPCGSAATLTWNAHTCATGFKVYMDTNPSPTTLVANSTATSYYTGNLLSNTTYYWKIVPYSGGGDGATSTWSFTTQTAINVAISQDTSGCYDGGLCLTASAGAFPDYYWYDVPVNGTPVGTGTVYCPVGLTVPTTLYVSNVLQGPASSINASTTNNVVCLGPAPSELSDGMFFDVKAKSANVTVTSLDLMFEPNDLSPAASSTLRNVKVYYRPTSYGSYTGSSAGWILVDNLNISVMNTPTAVTPVNITDIFIPAGSTYGIYVVYNAAIQTGAGLYANTDIEVSTGAVACDGEFSGVFPDLSFRGTVYYNISCSSPTIPVLATPWVSTAQVKLALATVTNAKEQCTENGWTYYANPTANLDWLFAIKKNGNSFTADVDIVESPSVYSNINVLGQHGSFLISRYWNVRVTSGSVVTPVDVRFFFDTAEVRAAYNMRNFERTTNYPTSFDVPWRWFKSIGADFNPAVGIDGNIFTFTNFTPTSVNNYNLLGATYSGYTNNVPYVEFTSVPSFSGGTGGYGFQTWVGGVLPVKLLDFYAETEGTVVKVSWITETEINNDYFTVERSKDGYNYEVVDVIKSKNGNSNVMLNYGLIDRNPIKGVSYYRLKQTDYDGKFEYFKAVAVNVTQTYDDVTVYPNPVTGNGYLTFSSLKDDEQTVVIYDVAGRLVYQKQFTIKTGNNKLTLETINLTKGMYFIKMDNAEDGINLKFIKE